MRSGHFHPNNKVSVFPNKRGYSRVIEIDPLTYEIFGILHNNFTLFEINRCFVKASSKKCKLLLWGYERCRNINHIKK